jgi:hypothetical protein
MFSHNQLGHLFFLEQQHQWKWNTDHYHRWPECLDCVPFNAGQTSMLGDCIYYPSFMDNRPWQIGHQLCWPTQSILILSELLLANFNTVDLRSSSALGNTLSSALQFKAASKNMSLNQNTDATLFIHMSNIDITPSGKPSNINCLD